MQFPSAYQNKYFFADLTGGWIRVFDPSNYTAAPFATGISTPVDLRIATDGSLYYLARGNGSFIVSALMPPPALYSTLTSLTPHHRSAP